MATPPITIGTFDNVPAPGSPIQSAWAQEVSTFVHQNSVQLYPTVADFKADSLARVGIVGVTGTANAARSLIWKVGASVVMRSELTMNAATSDGFGVCQLTAAQTGCVAVQQCVASCFWSTTNDTPAIVQARPNGGGISLRFHKISAAGAITAAASVACTAYVMYVGTV